MYSVESMSETRRFLGTLLAWKPVDSEDFTRLLQAYTFRPNVWFNKFRPYSKRERRAIPDSNTTPEVMYGPVVYSRVTFFPRKGVFVKCVGV